MMSPREGAPPAGAAGAAWRRAAALAFAVAAIGLPVNHIAAYLLPLIVAVIVFTGEVSGRASAWVAAAIIVVAALGGQWLLSPSAHCRGPQCVPARAARGCAAAVAAGGRVSAHGR